MGGRAADAAQPGGGSGWTAGPHHAGSNEHAPLVGVAAAGSCGAAEEGRGRSSTRNWRSAARYGCRVSSLSRPRPARWIRSAACGVAKGVRVVLQRGIALPQLAACLCKTLAQPAPSPPAQQRPSTAHLAHGAGEAGGLQAAQARLQRVKRAAAVALYDIEGKPAEEELEHAQLQQVWLRWGLLR